METRKGQGHRTRGCSVRGLDALAIGGPRGAELEKGAGESWGTNRKFPACAGRRVGSASRSSVASKQERKETSLRFIVVKLPKANKKEKILKAPRGEEDDRPLSLVT